MKKKSSLLQGTAYLLQGLQLLTVPGLRQFVLIPLLLNTSLFAVGIWYSVTRIQAWTNDLLPSWLQWMGWLIMPLFYVVIGTTLFWTFSMVANLLAAPFNALLAQRVELHLTGRVINPLNTTGMLQEIISQIGSEINKIIYFLTRAIPLLILFWIPVINIIAPFTWLIFSGWMMAFQYTDIPMGNHGLKAKQILAKLQENRLLALGFGGATLLMSLIPFVNFLAMPAAVAGATVLWVKEWGE